MRKSTIYRLALLVAVMLPLALASCKKDDPNPDNGTPVKPSTEISDPEGTITLSMRNADSGKTYLDNQFYIDNENFTGGYFVSLGPVKGLGNVSTIPLKGWSSQVAVIPGNGYVAYNPYNDTFYRLYVVQEIGSTSGGVIGAEVKYQKPFKGADEALSLLTTVAAIPGSGESREVLFANTTLVPFTATSSEGWCHVEKCSSYDYHFLTNGVSIWCDENLDTQPRSATVTLTTGYGKTATIAVTQSGPEPFVEIDSEQSFQAVGGTVDVNFATNVDVKTLSISGAPDWLTAEINAVNVTSRVRFIGNRAITKQITSQYGYVRLTVEPNTSGSARKAKLAIKSSAGSTLAEMNVAQEENKIELSLNRIICDRKGLTKTITVNGFGDYNATSTADWCTVTKSTDGNLLTITIKPTEENRKCEIKFEGFSNRIEVKQSKYAINDEYNENGIDGIVGYIDINAEFDCIGFVYRKRGEASWSTESVVTGATDEWDGRNNMAKIKSRLGWYDKYPAFALVEALNVNGVSGWYLPAQEELGRMKQLIVAYSSWWSSTEIGSESARSWYAGWDGTPSLSWNNKSRNTSVIAIHRFDF